MARTRAGEHDGRSRPALDAATVVAVRDGADGLEVLVQERHVETDFVGGALVFPGGRVEETDRDLPEELWVGGDPADIGDRLGADERGGLGLLVAAARESFEEAGLLFALDAEGRPVGPDVLADPEVEAARAALAARDDLGDFPVLLREKGLRLRLDLYHPFAWWVTPEGLHRRYDTRFFVVRTPEEQLDTARSDEVETTSARWLTPADCLAGGQDGRFTIIFPTRKVLAELAEHATVDDLLRAVQGRRPPRIQPEIVEVDGTVMVQHPHGGEPEIP